MLCFALLGLIDQRRGSAEGNLQMAMTNLTGPVLACMLLPGMKREFWHRKSAAIWAGICVVGIPVGILLGRRLWESAGQWDTAVINVAVAGFLILYVLWDREEIRQKGRLSRFWLWTILGMLLLMQLSAHETLWPAWFLVFFGCFYLIGIPDQLEDAFLYGMLSGIILWFFVQQIIAFGFRPYDYIRYRGLYSGETQNGLFYMIVFCAFTGAWLCFRKAKSVRLLKALCFLLSAGSIAFLLLTGGRASLLGAGAAAVVAYMLYDLVVEKSFRHWIPQGIALVICTVLLFPAVYGCVRYLPTVLRHPIWFEGEYNAATSVHSFDPWDSAKYVSFEEALSYNLGRVLRIFGIRIDTADGEARLETPLSLRALAAEDASSGRSKDNPYVYEETDYSDSVSIRKTIYHYYLTHLNLTGHKGEESGFYMSDGSYGYHAHNMFLQIAYDDGILAGSLFLVWSIACLVRLVRRKDLPGIICAAFFTAICVYGLAEMAVTTGQITLVMMFILYYFALRERC